MRSLEKSAGQDLEEFKKMMEELKPYLPPPTRIIEPKPLKYICNDKRNTHYHIRERNPFPNL
ncbi:MAG: hypothetical protein WC584_01360 [Candidatus Pacearchaeota archaeon]